MKELDSGSLEALLHSWKRNNTIMCNLLNALPPSSLGIRAIKSSLTVAEIFTHIIYIRLVHVYEDAPEYSSFVPEQEWVDVQDKERLAHLLVESAKAVHKAVKGRLEAGKGMDIHYDPQCLCFNT